MKVFQAGVDVAVGVSECGHCGCKIRAGQWVLEWLKLDNQGLYTKVRVTTHIKCIRELMTEAGVPNEGIEAFKELREQMAATGRVFP